MTALAMLNASDAVAEGARLFAAGAFDRAAESYGRALQADPRHPGALLGLGDLCEVAGETDRAASLFRTATRIAGSGAAPWRKLAELLERAGRVPEAIDAYAKARAHSPNDLEILRGLGNVQRVSGDLDGAQATLEQAAVVAPGDAQTMLFLGAVHLARGQYSEALSLFDRLRSSAPALPEPQFFAAVCLQALLRHDDAIEVLQALLRAHAPRKEWLNMLGASLFARSRFDEALVVHRQALAFGPTDSDTAVRIAHCQTMLRDFDGAMATVERVLAIAPDDQSALCFQVQLLITLDQKERAREICERLLRIDPDHAFAWSKLMTIRLGRCLWDGYDAFIEGISAYIARATAAGQAMQLTIQDLHNLPIAWEQEVAAARNVAAAIEAKAAPVRARLGFRFEDRLGAWRRGERRKLRIGYTLPYTKEESFTLLHKAVVDHHDHSRFEVFAYAGQPATDSAFDREYRASFDVVRDTGDLPTDRAAQLVFEDRIDVLLDATGHTGENCQALVALRPAPVTAQTFGYSISTGAPYVDYLVTDPVFMPPEMAALCSETVVYLPDALLPGCRPEVSERVFTRAELQLPDDGFVFTDFNQPFKFEPTMFSAWMRVLARVSGSVLWLGKWDAGARANLCREAEARGISAHRLVFSEKVSRADHLARLRQADLVLDTRWHSGGATTLDAFWVGVPIVTLADRTPASRNGATFARALEMPEMVTNSLQEFEDLAVRVATDRALHQAWRAEVDRNRLTAPLFDAKRFTRGFELAIEAMWEQAVAGTRSRIQIETVL